ncbi:helicase required for RNAi-mediated heterochromatin assembly 1 [Arthroderma uncinatum]|uniref:helicase required for RNAi-mediated heterochromatin assembly 1 n=1 Tax=Arthroderma uncinatum TaxID=74035 RepID=UPI00144ADCA3|nr:helicase required for RNAi-mediated heterochromatin assembly 1 [Arthroderma uncinatum]KAF3479697.1 helicase required for RNAi-mediated heterochromatin assembly 1 [Arthroderma uncinatum]
MWSRDFRRGRGRGGPPLHRPFIESPPTIQIDKEIREYVTKAARSGTPGTWTAKPELPASGEILGLDDGEVISLGVNQLQGPWPSSENYLKTHYELLREDAVAPLRDAVAYFRHDPKMSDSPHCCVYEKVHMVGMTFAQAGIAVRVQFSTVRAGKKIVWEYSKRLMTGNIVALSPANDAFQTKCIVATIAARPLDGLKASPPEIDLFFARPEDAEFDYQQAWVMVEGRVGYFEAARHTLSALQKLTSESFPLSEYICDLKPKIEAPRYLQENPMIRMSTVLPDENISQTIDINKEWPKHPESLDPSQWKAFQQIMTKRLSIVQGPPGTGKTHVSVMAVKAMLDNIQRGDPPIIIAAQTNHALDQLLRHISKFEEKYVRLGGRSMDTDIRMRTVFELRKKNNLPSTIGGALGPARKELRELTEQVIELLSPFRIENARAPLQPSLFLNMGVISIAQHDSLINGAAGWVRAGDQADPMSVWLGDSLVKFEVLYKQETFGFAEEDIDLEYEQLKELEAEHGLDDDDYETLKGQYIGMREFCTARGPAIYSGKSVESNYLKYEDMWKIPSGARAATYALLQKRVKEVVRRKFCGMLERYNTVCRNLKIGKWERDSIILRDSRVVGMTTTGLSKYRALVSSLHPKIILIEEAAEVIESPVTVACMESLQHLILVGDHQQLRGSCSMQELEGDPFYLNISMFERLVRNSIPFRRLTSQRRMAPEIRRILSPIYSDLLDHPSVLTRPDVPGMGGINSYFFTHTWPESFDSLSSKYNANEAKMIVGFYVYLHMNGVPVQDITVLTFYNGQRKKILKALKDNPLFQGQYAKVVTVDSYQGEENEIVLLSLVRSNDYDNIGFLATENRVCVALSRAKRGFYIFGNAESLAISNGLWWQVTQIMRKEPKRLGYFLPLTCKKHQTRTLISNENAWSDNDGGCSQRCGEKLSCGHTCPLLCHALCHSKLQCQVKCDRTLPCGHKCTDLCFRDCKCPCASANRPALSSTAKKRPVIPRAAEFLLSDANAEERALLAKRYQNFATGGGAQIEDARLAKEAENLALQERLQKMDEEACIDLFGDENLPNSPTKAKQEISEVISGGNGGVRMKFTQFYSNSGAPAKYGNDDDKAPSLLD